MRILADLAMAAGTAVVGGFLGRALFGGWSTEWTWSGTIMTPYDPATVRAALDDWVLQQLGFTRRRREAEYDGYSRGDWSIEQLPTAHDVHWYDVPLLLICRYKTVAGRTHVEFEYFTDSDLRFNEKGREFLKTEAEREFDRTFDWVKTRDWDSPTSGSGGEGPGRDRSDEDDSAEAADFAALGLKVGAGWQQVQSAYREACKKFHPDRLAGKELDPDVVELAASRFREINEAYKRLKAVLGRG